MLPEVKWFQYSGSTQWPTKT